jgi:hypothetical protein
MKVSSTRRYALGASALLVILVGCGGGSQSQIAPSGPMPAAALQSAQNPPSIERLANVERRALASHAAKVRAWMAPDAKPQALLYVSNTASGTSGPGTVNVYAWPSLKQLGSLIGFTMPYAMCVDKAQDVYITDFLALDIVEYAHGSIVPIRTLHDAYGMPDACSIDPTTGNLAVGNAFDPHAGLPGNLLVYAGASGTPKEYEAPNISHYWFPAYDDKGDLFANGESSSDVVSLAELPKGKSKFKPITMNQSIEFPGGVQWDGEYLAVADQEASVIYQFTISGSNATVEGSTTLGDADDVYQFWVTGGSGKHPQGTKVVGADYGASASEVWAYPAGGTPLKSITSGLDNPEGVVISK